MRQRRDGALRARRAIGFDRRNLSEVLGEAEEEAQYLGGCLKGASAREDRREFRARKATAENKRNTTEREEPRKIEELVYLCHFAMVF